MFRDLYVVDAEGGEPAALTKGDALVRGALLVAGWSAIACRFRPGRTSTSRATARSPCSTRRPASARPLTTSLDRNCAPVSRGPRAGLGRDSLLFVLEDGGNRALYRVPADGSAPPEPVVDGESELVGFDCVGGQIVHAAALPPSPAERLRRARPG